LIAGNAAHGVLPLDWLALLGPVAGGGQRVDGVTRYKPSQVALLDSLLDTVPDADVDETFARARDELRTFDRIGPVDPSPTFVGTLREYQREGLGWLHFLRRFQLGGCLADDMGLGKTVQVIALHLRRHEQQAVGERRPTLVICPASLLANWEREIERFAPGLPVRRFHGGDRTVSDVAADGWRGCGDGSIDQRAICAWGAVVGRSVGAGLPRLRQFARC
jgi:hypothetical protein